MSLKLNSPGGGSITLQEPTTSSDRTLNLPDSSGTIIASDASGNVGIGTSSPDVVANYRTLNLNGTTGGIFYFKSNGTNVAQVSGDSTGTTLYTLGNQDLLFGTNNIERGRFDTSGNFRFNSGYGSVATAYGCRAWVNFNGTGTVAIRASGNVSSITDNGNGDYTVNFTTAMPDANYALSGGASRGSGDTGAIGPFGVGIYQATVPATSSVRIQTGYGGSQASAGLNIDAVYVCVAIHR